MNRRLLILPGTVALAGAIALAACTSTTPAATTGTGGGVPTPPVGGLPSFSIPPISLPSLGTSQLCAGKPTIDVTGSAQPSFANDPDLAARFPQQIAGTAPDRLQTFKFIDEICVFGGTGLDQMAAAFSQAGIDITTATVGEAQYSLPAPCTDATESPCLNTESLSLTALRSPGGDSNRMVTGFAQLAAALGQTDKLQNIQQSNVGGKNVYTSAQTGGTVSYVYPSGDTLWLFATGAATTAAAVLSALP